MPHRDPAGRPEIRPAEPADAPAVTILLHELGYPSNSEEEVTARLTRWSGVDGLLALVATDGPRAVGVIALAVVPYFERPGSWGRVVALVVDAEARARGVGRRLLTAAERAARDRGCVRAEISCSRHRTGAHAFYRSMGYTDHSDRSGRFLKDL